MSKIKISVIIPAYNVERYIGECLDSLQKQGIDDMEIICVDDASTDNTLSIIESFAKCDNRIQVIRHERNRKLSVSRNDGWNRARGEYIYNLDSDDYLIEGSLAELYVIAIKNNLDVLSFSGEAFVDDSLVLSGQDVRYMDRYDSYMRRGEYSGCQSGPEIFAQLLDNNDPIGNWSLHLIKREMLLKNKLSVNTEIVYDEDDLFPIYMYAQRAMCIKKVCYMRRFRSDSIVTSKKTLEKAEDIMIRMINDMKLWDKLSFSEELNARLEQYFRLSQQSLMNMINGLNVEEMEKEYTKLWKHPMSKFLFDYYVLKKSRYRNLSEQVLKELQKKNDIVLYGAGLVAEDVANLLESRGILHYKVVVTNKRDVEQKFRNREIYEASYWKGDWENTTVIIAINARGARDSICNFLHIQGCTKIIMAD